MKLREIAHSRTGDKGNISVISLIPYDEADFELLKENITAEKVALFFKDIVHGEVERYELQGIKAFNVVMQNALDGGVTRSLAVDMHGKSLAAAFLEMEL